MELDLVVTPDKNSPLYLQLKHQLAYLINSRQLPDKFKLPPVHDLAKNLGINPGTVARAYKELQAAGLIILIQGKGTFVLARPKEDLEDRSIRQDMLIKILEQARRKAFALGFDDIEIEQWMKSILSSADCYRETAFVSYALPTAHKYSKIIEDHLYSANIKTRVKPLRLEDLEQDIQSISEILEPAYYVITLVSLVHRVEKALNNSRAWNVVGIPTEITSETLDQLANLPREVKACLIIQERSLYRSLSLIEQHTVLDSGTLPCAFDTTPDIVAKVASEAELVVHTLDVRELLDRLSIPSSKRLELRYKATPESLGKLTNLFKPTN